MSRTQCAIAIFAKTVGLSPVKTRLAQSIGQDQAECFYHQSQRQVCQTVGTIKSEQIDLYIAVAEEEGVTHKYWQNHREQDFQVIWTGQGTLGDRLHSIYSHLKQNYDSVIIIGTDSPQLESDLLLEASRHLEQNPKQIVIGASVDGGFYLFGGAIDLPDFVFKNVTYSRHDTLKQLVHQLSTTPIHYLDTKLDVDTLDDLIALHQEFSSCKRLSWLKQFLPCFVFKNVAYSQHDTFKQFIHQLSTTLHYLDNKLDMETLDDLVTLHQKFSSCKRLSWLKQFLP